jgi:hypothetical protein
VESITCKPVSSWVGGIEVEGTEKEDVLRAFEHVLQMPASQEELCSNVLQ